MRDREFEKVILEATGLTGKHVKSMTFHFHAGQAPQLLVEFNGQDPKEGLSFFLKKYELTLKERIPEQEKDA